MEFVLFVVFFFSSRRRHTRSLCDWSSDVCSSDLRRGSVCLGIAINEKSGLFGGGKTGGKIDSGCRLAYSTLLVCDGDNSSQCSSASENLTNDGLGCKMFHVERRWLYESELEARRS